jgi:diguanylate cyclase (GGDEF)-like protein
MMKGRNKAYPTKEKVVGDLEETISSKLGIDQADLLILEKRMQDGKTGVIYAQTATKSLALVYTPVGVGESYLVAVLDNAYIEKQVEEHWKPIKDMVVQCGFAVLAFMGSILMITIITNIRENQKKEELSVKADTDLLTDLNNKLATERKIKKYINDHPNQQGMLFVLDIDNFKKINDTMGHAFGDQVLRELGQHLPAQFRATDIIGRTGGDEFTLFLKDIRDEEIAKKEAKKVLYFFRNFQAGGYVKYSATASIGVAMFPRDGEDFETLYKSADNALYVAKKRGKNQLAFFGEECEACPTVELYAEEKGHEKSE